MRIKIIATIVMTLLIVATVLPVAGTMNVNKNVIEIQDPLESESFPLEDDEWPMFQHDLENTGYSPSIAPQNDTVLWTFETGLWVTSSPAVCDGKVYFFSFDEYFYCLDADTGEQIWNYSIPGASVGCCCPAIYDGKVYFASGYYNIYCWDADTGSLIWTIPKPYGTPYSPAVYGGKVYISYDDDDKIGILLCLDADTGGMLWNRSFSGIVRSHAVYDGKVYIGCNDRYLYCLNADTGYIMWSYLGNAVMRSPPAIVDGKVYSGSGGGCCLDAETGEELWTGTINYWVLGSPAVAYGCVYIDTNTYIYCLDATTGEEIWKYPTGLGSGLISPAVADGKVYVSITATGYFICLDAYTGEKLWDYFIDSSGYFESSPVIAYGRVYVGGGATCKIYCFGHPSRPPYSPTIDAQKVGLPGQEIEFTIKATDPEDDDVYFYVDWDDGNNTGWIGPYGSGQKITISHIWTEIGTYVIRARAKDINELKSQYSELDMTITNAPNPPTINGETNGKKGTEYEYVFYAIDPNGDDVKYYIDWNDGSSDTTAFSPSGTDAYVKHTWSEQGDYIIKAKAIDIYGIESDWSEFKVTFPRNKMAMNTPFLNFLQTLQKLLQRLGLQN